MRIALISDLHGNEVALRAVLDDVARTGADRIVCLGDVATLGPRPNEVLAVLRDLRCECVVGNHDAFMLDPRLVRSYTEAAEVLEAVEWCREQLSAADLAFLRTFVTTLEIPLEDGGKALLFHGTPRSHLEDLLVTTPPGQVDEMLEGCEATVFAGGHTHLQMLRQHRGMLIVNPGSVGMPFKEYVAGRVPTLLRQAEYAILDAHPGGVAVELRRIALDPQALRAAAAACTSPFRPMLLRHYA